MVSLVEEAVNSPARNDQAASGQAKPRRVRNLRAVLGPNTITKDRKTKNNPAMRAMIPELRAQPQKRTKRTKILSHPVLRTRLQELRIPIVIRHKHLVPQALPRALLPRTATIPKASGAEGAAAGAAVSNRNNPQHSGAQGAAAGAAVSNRNNPQYSGAQGAAAGAAVANRNQPQYSGAQGAAAAAGYAGVRNNVDHPGMYGQGWYSEHQSAWAPSGWAAGAAWTPATWRGVSTQFGYDIDTAPVSYNYGSNVTCIGGNVVVDGQPAGTAEEFSQQADELAEKGTAAAASPDDKWMPLGVFALVRNEQQHPQLIMQLAVNQQGIVRGNYTDEVTDTTLTVHGAVDPKTQRAAWTIGDNKYSVMEAGLNNLTQSEVASADP